MGARTGLTAHGEVRDPTTAVEHDLLDFDANEVIVVTQPREQETWQEYDELERLRRELDAPVTHLVIGDRGSRPR